MPIPTDDLVENPAWLARAVADNFATIQAKAHAPAWMPVLTKMKAAGRGNRLTADLAQLGCGVYGCVMPTADAGVVFKVTSDSSEVEFIATVIPKVNPPGIVRYYDMVELDGYRYKARLYGIWRESADAIGQVSDDAVALLNEAHEVSDQVYAMLHDAVDPHALYLAAANLAINYNRGDGDAAELCDLIQRLVELWRDMAEDADELMPVGQALLAWLDAGVLVADVHPDNVGHVERDGRDLVVITDPGHTAILPTPWPF